MKKRARTAQNLSRLSPTALFQYASENIARSGTDSEEWFLKDVRNFSTVYDDYILRKVGKLVGTSSWSFSTYFEINGKPVSIGSPSARRISGRQIRFPAVYTKPVLHWATV